MTARLSRVLFFGTPAFAVPSLERLLASRYRVVGAVTQPDRPRGRGQRVSEGPVKRVAASQGIPVLQPDRLKEPQALDAIRALDADVAVVAAYGKILPEAVIESIPHGFINVHASLLPRYRGAAPIQRAVMAGETETGISIMRIVRELDAGPVFATSTTPIGPEERADEVERRLADAGAALLIEVLDQIAAGQARETPQEHALATYASRISREDGLIDWSRPAASLHDQVRGLHPWPHAYTFLGADRLILHRTRVDDRQTGAGADEHPAPPGTVVASAGDRFSVACGDGRALDLLLVQPEGRKPMEPRDYLAGHRIAPGQRLGQG